MIIYKDILTDAEIISDGYNLKEVDGIVFEADTFDVTNRTETFDLLGANPSAEEEAPSMGGDPTGAKEQKFDLTEAFRLQKLDMDDPKQKKDYYTHHVKTYMKKVVEALKANGTDEAIIKEFQAGAVKYVKKILKDMKEYDLYRADVEEPDGMHVLLGFREDGMTPFVTVWKHGLTEMKV